MRLVRKDSSCEISNERWQFTVESAALWLKECSDEEGMIAKFSSTHLSFKTSRSCPKIAGKQRVLVFGIGAITAAVPFSNSLRAVTFAENAVWFQYQVCLGFDQRTT